MGKIDEVYQKHVLNQGDENTDYSMVFKVMDELKPYVELAEYICEHLELIKTDWHGAASSEYFKTYIDFRLLLDNIKEQSK